MILSMVTIGVAMLTSGDVSEKGHESSKKVPDSVVGKGWGSSSPVAMGTINWGAVANGTGVARDIAVARGSTIARDIAL